MHIEWYDWPTTHWGRLTGACCCCCYYSRSIIILIKLMLPCTSCVVLLIYYNPLQTQVFNCHKKFSIEGMQPRPRRSHMERTQLFTLHLNTLNAFWSRHRSVYYIKLDFFYEVTIMMPHLLHCQAIQIAHSLFTEKLVKSNKYTSYSPYYTPWWTA